MGEPTNILGDALRAEIKEIVREALREELAKKTSGTEKDTLNADQAAALIGVDRRWLYRHAAKLPFAHRISRKNLRFSEAGLRRWIATKKP
jgi:predicted DNA-binding transcriptional regulator AlpA